MLFAEFFLLIESSRLAHQALYKLESLSEKGKGISELLAVWFPGERTAPVILGELLPVQQLYLGAASSVS